MSACDGAVGDGAAEDEFSFGSYALVTAPEGFYFFPPIAPAPVHSGAFAGGHVGQLVVHVEHADASGAFTQLDCRFDHTTVPKVILKPEHERYSVNLRLADCLHDRTASYRFRVTFRNRDLATADLPATAFDFIDRYPDIMMSMHFRIEDLALDRDGDGVLDLDDHCPDHADPANPPPSTEVCDGADNDCDGQVDEDASSTCPQATNGTAACVAGACVVNSCSSPFLNCDGNTANGCEVDSQANNAHCGACNNTCPSGQSCYAGACTNTCTYGALDFTLVAGCTNVSLHRTYAASGVYAAAAPQYAADGNRCTSWNAGGYPSQWWRVDFGGPIAVRGMSVQPNMLPTTANVTHIVEMSNNATTWTAVRTISQVMTAGNLYQYDFGTPVSARYFRVRTTSSPSWVAWGEIGFFACP